MRFLGIGGYCDLGDMYLRLAREGHDVRVHVSAKESRQTFAGLIERCADWRAELSWIRAAGGEGIILFEGADRGVVQDELRAEGYNVIGGGAFGDRLEADRDFGRSVLHDAGIATAPLYAFTSFAAGIDHIRGKPGRYVLKPNGTGAWAMESYVGQLDDGSDVIDVLASLDNQPPGKTPPSYILMDHLQGVEVGVGAFFNGAEFLKPVCIDFEHKRFFTGNLGELTGEMGTLVSWRGGDRIFDATLAKIAPRLADSGYRGWINLNTIIDARGIWPLEFTARFGYPGFAILSPLQTEGWGPLLRRLCDRSSTRFETRDGFSVGVVLTVPPFPYQSTEPPSPANLRILFRAPVDDSHLHFCEVAKLGDRLLTAGIMGQVMVVTGTGDTVPAAQAAAYGRVDRVIIANMRYRTDIGSGYETRDAPLLREWGWLA